MIDDETFGKNDPSEQALIENVSKSDERNSRRTLEFSREERKILFHSIMLRLT